MEIKTGNTRYVFVFQNIVIKVARIYLLKAILTINYRISFEIGLVFKKRKKYFSFLKERKKRRREDKINFETERMKKEESSGLKVPKTKKYECYSTVNIFLLAGIMANLQEWRFYRKTKNIFVMPTYFSFLGIINIQKRGSRICFWDDVGVRCYIHKNCQNSLQLFCDGHTLSNIDNFCLDGKNFRMVDYGSRYIESFLEVNGKNLYENFKIPD